MNIPIPYTSIEGKTYSLFGKSSSTNEYYQLVAKLADEILEKYNYPESLIPDIQKYSENKRKLKRDISKKYGTTTLSHIIHLLNSSLVVYTESVGTHLKSLPLRKFWDRRLSTSREQYYLYMLEIELTNRLNIIQFKNTDKKIALLPYCLRDIETECKSITDEFDYQCRFCSKNCYQN